MKPGMKRAAKRVMQPFELAFDTMQATPNNGSKQQIPEQTFQTPPNISLFWEIFTRLPNKRTCDVA